MSILDWFKFPSPKYKKFGVFVSRYLTPDDQLRKLFLDIGLSECLDVLEV